MKVTFPCMFCLIVLAACCVSCNIGRSPASFTTPLTAEQKAALDEGAKLVMGENGNRIVVRPLSDPENPFRDSYRSWDEWVYANIADDSWRIQLRQGATYAEIKEYNDSRLGLEFPDYGPNAFGLRTQVTPDGHLIPLVEGLQLWEDAKKGVAPDWYSPDLPWVSAEGQMDKALQQEALLASDVVLARGYPPVPDWLAADPPWAAVLLPSGEVVTKGELGSWDEEAFHSSRVTSHAGHGEHDGEGGADPPVRVPQNWYRFSAEGELIATALGHWWFTFLPHGHESRPEGTMDAASLPGYILFKDPQTGTVLNVYSYNGEKLEEVPNKGLNGHNFFVIDGGMLIRLKQGQGGL